MAQDIKLIVYPVKDLAAAKKLYGTYLGVEPYADGDYYVGYKLGNLEVGLDPNGSAVIAYVDTTDIEADLKKYMDAGATIQQDPKDVGGGLLIAKIEDADGNVLGLSQEAK